MFYFSNSFLIIVVIDLDSDANCIKLVSAGPLLFFYYIIFYFIILRTSAGVVHHFLKKKCETALFPLSADYTIH
jgi:hypothetical protein